MLVSFLACPGYTEELFWSLTPSQIEAHFKAARRRYRVERNTLMETAYLGSNAANFKKPLKLEDLLMPVEDRPRRQASQPWEQQLAALRQIMKAKRKGAD